jgi:hypothetical protein
METSREIVNGKSRLVATLPISYNGKEDKVKIKKLNFGEYGGLQRASMKMKALGNNMPQLDIDQVAMNENSIVMSVIEAPWALNDINIIRDLDTEIAQSLLQAITEINNPTDKKKET